MRDSRTIVYVLTKIYIFSSLLFLLLIKCTFSSSNVKRTVIIARRYTILVRVDLGRLAIIFDCHYRYYIIIFARRKYYDYWCDEMDGVVSIHNTIQYSADFTFGVRL